MNNKPLNIFISHPSSFLTDNQANGDGLAAFEFINRLAERGHKIHVAVASMDIKRKFSDNITLYPVNLTSPFCVFKSLEYIVRVKLIFNQLIRQHNVDIIHQLNPVNPGLSCLLVNNKIPTVLGLFWPNWPELSLIKKSKRSFVQTLLYKLVNYIVKKCDSWQQTKASALLLSTPAAIQQIHQPDICQNKIHILPYGIDPTDASLVDCHDARIDRNKQLSILYLASINYRKGIFTLLEAFERVILSIPACKLAIAGTGEDLQLVREKIQQMSCSSQITLLGNVPRENVLEVMSQCTVYCLPSYGEPFGISALEAMSCGKPVVATDAGGLAYLVDNKGGIKVPSKDEIALSQALIKILNSPQLQQKMGQHNLSLVNNTYSWNKIIERLEKIYYSLSIPKYELENKQKKLKLANS